MSTIPDRQPVPPTASQRLRFTLYLLPVLLFPVLLLASAFFILPTRWFALRGGNTYYADMGYGELLHNQSCDILIYGDSSAMVGVDPAILHELTGLTACNIAEFEGMTLINHTVVLDDFLAHNPRPRFIVFMFTPEDLYIPASWSKGVSTFEGISFLVQTGPLRHTVRLLAAHPLDTFAWTEQGMRMVLTHLASKPLSVESQQLRVLHGGRLPVPESTRTTCYESAPPFEAPDPAWIASLRAKYSVDGTRVLVDATPTVACDPGLGFYQQHLDPLIDNTPYRPIALSDYSTDGRLHANNAGVRTLSSMIASQIAPLLQPSGGR